ncbi:MAG: ARMT1-like domain-containing protein, partial [Candidatus Promineifilaceae bacterium]
MNTPRLPVPTPLRGIDTDYTKDSIVRRLAEILQRTLAENELPETAVAQLAALHNSIPHGPITQLPNHLAPDLDDWQRHIEPYRGQNWLEIPWFFVETYFYRRIVAAVDHFRSGIDPFAHQKRESLRTATNQTQALVTQLNQFIPHGWQPGSFRHLLLADLWGNQADMSMWAAGDDAMPNHANSADQTDHLLVDEETAVT